MIVSSGVNTFTDAINANGGLTVNGDLDLYGSAGVSSVTWDKSDNALEFLDHAKATFGTGGDLSIYHDGANSYLQNTTGHIVIKDTTDKIYLQSSEIVFEDDTTTENLAKFISDGACELYFDNSKKIETTFHGAIVTGILTATSFSGTLDTAAQPNITSLGTIASLVASTAKVSDLTNNRIVIAGASGELEDSANLTFDNTGLVVTGNLNVTGVTTIQGYSSLPRSMGISQVLGNICRYAGDNVQSVVA